MKRERNNLLVVKYDHSIHKASFNTRNRLTILESENIKINLLEIITKKHSTLEINLSGIKFVDSAIIDVFNLLSRLSAKYKSKLMLTNVTTELLELFELVKLHSVFDIKHIEAANDTRSVA